MKNYEKLLIDGEVLNTSNKKIKMVNEIEFDIDSFRKNLEKIIKIINNSENNEEKIIKLIKANVHGYKNINKNSIN